MAEFRMTKFCKNDSGRIQIRYETLPNGKVIAFGVALTDLTTMQFDSRVDFDKESDEILEKFRNSRNNMAFQYIPDTGFAEVDINKQQWFVFR